MKFEVRRPSSTLHTFFLAVVVFLIFLPCLKADFVYWDDDTHLFANPQTASISADNLGKIFTSSVNDTYIPLTTLSYAVERHFFGLNPCIYHLDNLLLHIANVILIFILAGWLGLGNTAAFFAALLFGIHPMHVESVAWVTGRKDVLYSFFYLLSVLCYCRYLLNSSRRDYNFSLLAATLSVLAKPLALSLPLALWIVDLRKGRPLNSAAFWNKVPFMAVITAAGWVTFLPNAHILAVQTTHSLLVWVWCAAFYLQKFFFPFGLSPIYHAPLPITLTQPEYLKSVLIVILAGLSFFRSRSNPVWRFALLWYAASDFFIWRFYHDYASTVADRFMYLPSLGFCLFFGGEIERWWNWASELGGAARGLLLTTLASVLFVLLTLTKTQCLVWQNDWSFWEDVLRKYPYDTIAHTNRGIFLALIGEDRKAMDDFGAAIRARPTNFVAYLNRGKLFAKYGQWQLALEDYDRAINQPLNAKTFLAFYYRGLVNKAAGLEPQARRDFEQALTLKPDFKLGIEELAKLGMKP